MVTVAVALLAMNAIAWGHARAMTHFVRAGSRTAAPEKLDALGKVRVLLAGVTLARPENRRTPQDVGLEFEPRRFSGAHALSL
jgi:hypothetical protein